MTQPYTGQPWGGAGSLNCAPSTAQRCDLWRDHSQVGGIWNSVLRREGYDRHLGAQEEKLRDAKLKSMDRLHCIPTLRPCSPHLTLSPPQLFSLYALRYQLMAVNGHTLSFPPSFCFLFYSFPSYLSFPPFPFPFDWFSPRTERQLCFWGHCELELTAISISPFIPPYRSLHRCSFQGSPSPAFLLSLNTWNPSCCPEYQSSRGNYAPAQLCHEHWQHFH